MRLCVQTTVALCLFSASNGLYRLNATFAATHAFTAKNYHFERRCCPLVRARTRSSVNLRLKAAIAIKMNQAAEDETTSLIFETPRPRKKTFREILGDEFRWRSFCFDFSNASVFNRSQWRFPRLFFVVFRLCLALYTVIICILTLVYFPRKNPHRPWIVWLTNWSFLLLTTHEIVSATIVLVHSNDRTTGFCCRELEENGGEEDVNDDGGTKGARSQERKEGDGKDSLPFYLKFSWLLYCVASPVAILVTLLILSTYDIRYLSVKDFNNHIMNGVVVVLEVFVAALPVRLLHVVYITAFYTIYFLFALVFWSFDHTGNVLYFAMIDWNEPGETMLSWLKMAILRPITVQLFLFFVYRLKVFISAKIFGDEE